MSASVPNNNNSNNNSTTKGGIHIEKDDDSRSPFTNFGGEGAAFNNDTTSGHLRSAVLREPTTQSSRIRKDNNNNNNDDDDDKENVTSYSSEHVLSIVDNGRQETPATTTRTTSPLLGLPLPPRLILTVPPTTTTSRPVPTPLLPPLPPPPPPPTMRRHVDLPPPPPPTMRRHVDLPPPPLTTTTTMGRQLPPLPTMTKSRHLDLPLPPPRIPRVLPTRPSPQGLPNPPPPPLPHPSGRMEGSQNGNGSSGNLNGSYGNDDDRGTVAGINNTSHTTPRTDHRILSLDDVKEMFETKTALENDDEQNGLDEDVWTEKDWKDILHFVQSSPTIADTVWSYNENKFSCSIAWLVCLQLEKTGRRAHQSVMRQILKCVVTNGKNAASEIMGKNNYLVHKFCARRRHGLDQTERAFMVTKLAEHYPMSMVARKGDTLRTPLANIAATNYKPRLDLVKAVYKAGEKKLGMSKSGQLQSALMLEDIDGKNALQYFRERGHRPEVLEFIENMWKAECNQA